MMFFKRKEKLDLNSLKTIFESQKKILLEAGYPAILNISREEFNTKIENLWRLLSEKIDDTKINIKGNIPLLLVTGQGDIKEKIKKINGHTGLDLNKIKNNDAEKPNLFYIVLDVEDGVKMVAKSAKDSLIKFKKENRHALNLDESVALLTYYPEILKNHYLISAGTFYEKENETVPLLWLLDQDHNPELHYAWFDIAHGSYGTGSYAIKINQ
ncbi:MAG: DUF5701 family protein [Candidatus Staskawiczbacteria bacterium]|nr:DUF5701 family protein [Candidatus Staskawiczbacteria bacterium]